MLSRDEIASLAARSAEIREARRRRARPSQSKSEQLPPKQPRPVPIPVILPHRRHRRDTPSDSDSDSSDFDSYRRTRRGKGSYAGSDVTGPQSGYPNPHGAPIPPPSPLLSPTSTKERQAQGTWMRTPSSGSYTHQGGDYLPHSPSQGSGYLSKDRERDRDRERERERDRTEPRRHQEPRSEQRNREKERERDRERERATAKQQKRTRWKENLTAGAFGGAAVKLLDVLSEAADGLDF